LFANKKARYLAASGLLQKRAKGVEPSTILRISEQTQYINPVAGSKSGSNDPDLVALIRAWPSLPAAARRRVLAIVAKAHGCDSGASKGKAV
jgi:hypothetical protein